MDEIFINYLDKLPLKQRIFFILMKSYNQDLKNNQNKYILSKFYENLINDISKSNNEFIDPSDNVNDKINISSTNNHKKFNKNSNLKNSLEIRDNNQDNHSTYNSNYHSDNELMNLNYPNKFNIEEIEKNFDKQLGEWASSFSDE